jgi:hypothetical protein
MCLSSNINPYLYTAAFRTKAINQLDIQILAHWCCKITLQPLEKTLGAATDTILNPSVRPWIVSRSCGP